MISLDNISKGLLIGIILLVSMGWFREHLEVMHLVEVASHLGDGWAECMQNLEPGLDHLWREMDDFRSGGPLR